MSDPTAPERPSAGTLDERRRVGMVAARALEDLYAVVFRERPVGVRAWCDGTALLVVMRLAEASEPLALDSLPALVATAVRARTGWELAAGSASAEADLGLVMLVFRLPAQTPRGFEAVPSEPASRAALADLGLETPPHVPAWRSWTPVPAGGALPGSEPALEERGLRLVDG